MLPKKIKFYKMNGLGNEFVIIDNLNLDHEIDAKLIKRLSKKSTGPGCDQLISIDNAYENRIKIRVWNQDASEAEVCGNASRCVAKLFFEKEDHEIIEISTGKSKHICKKMANNQIIINMGQPSTSWKSIPTNYSSEDVLKFDYNFGIKELVGRHLPSLVNIGNPHIIFWLDNVDKISYQKLGPLIENHDIFPEKINVNFAQIIDPNQIGLIVWERGAGLTKACGSGASAVAYAAYKLNMVNSNVDIKLPGGILNVSIDEENYVYKSGPAELEYIEYYTGENINEE